MFVSCRSDLIQSKREDVTVKHLKVLILANDTTYTYNLRNEVIERLIAEGNSVVVASQPLLLQEELKELGCRLVDIKTDRHGRNLFSDLALLRKYQRVLSDEKPDVVLTYNIKPNAYGGMACRMAGIHYFPNITGLGTAMEYPGLMQKITTKLVKTGVAKADCIFFQNEENRQFFIDHHLMRRKTRTRLLPGSGVSLKMHKAMEYPMDENGIVFLFIARLMREKGIDLYLDAAEKIHEIHPRTEFHICGQCDDKNYIERIKEAESKKYIYYHGEQKDMVPFFEMAHCIVHPSYYPEGMSNVLLEAAAHCRPIITTDRAGCRETVDEGKSGFIIPVRDEDALVSALERFLKLTWEQRREMGLAGREKTEREFDRQIVAQAYVEEIERAIGNTNVG